VYIQRVDAGVVTQLGAKLYQEFAAGDKLGLQMIGSTISAYYQAAGNSWTLLGSVTDSTYSSAGYIGLGRNITGGSDLVIYVEAPNYDR
jgi:hypothetical protein